MEMEYDWLIIGSGFGGSVSALRLAEKGYRVGVLEAGRRYSDEDLPETSWDAIKFNWIPWLGGCGGCNSDRAYFYARIGRHNKLRLLPIDPQRQSCHRPGHLFRRSR